MSVKRPYSRLLIGREENGYYDWLKNGYRVVLNRYKHSHHHKHLVLSYMIKRGEAVIVEKEPKAVVYRVLKKIMKEVE